MHCSFLDNKSSFRIVSEQTPGNTPDIFGDVNCQEHRSTKIKNKTWETEHKASRIILEVKEIQPENKRRKIKKKIKKKEHPCKEQFGQPTEGEPEPKRKGWVGGRISIDSSPPPDSRGTGT